VKGNVFGDLFLPKYDKLLKTRRTKKEYEEREEEEGEESTRFTIVLNKQQVAIKNDTTRISDLEIETKNRTLFSSSVYNV
jgi:predicted HAD superfamily hydrolase